MSTPQKGIQIIEGGPKAINDAYEYRLLLELNAVRYFAATATRKGRSTSDGEGQTSLEALENHPTISR